MSKIALVATDLFSNKQLSILSISKTLGCSWISNIYTLSDQYFFPESTNIPLQSNLIKDRITSYKILLESGEETHYIFTNWDSFISAPASWDSRYTSFDFISTPAWIDEHSYLLGSSNFCLVSRKLLFALIENYENANKKNNDVNYWSNYEILSHAKKLVTKGIKFADQTVSQSFCYESGPILKNTFGISCSANFPYFLMENDLLIHANEIISRHSTPLTTLNYLRYCLETQKLELFIASVKDFHAKPNLKKAIEFELHINPRSELPSIIENLNR